MKDIFAELTWRGLIYQTTDDQNLPGWLMEKPRAVYAGFDPTADSLHVGSMVPLLTLRRFQQAGHRPIAIVGGATGMIGDPSGKSEERKLMSEDDLRANVAGIQQQMRMLLDFDCADNAAVLVNNFDWMQSFSYIEFLRDIGKNFPVNVMLAKDSVKSRLGRDDTGLSYTEFSYMLLQAYDFVHLNRQFGCELQIGGSDQWGNVTAGIDLARRMHQVQLYGMTCPLLTKSDGTKMGKTETGTVWLSPDRTSPYDFFQYWMKVADEDAGKCLRLLTELSQEEIQELDQKREEAPHQRDSQRALARNLTRLIHGDEGLTIAERATDVFFGAEIENLSDAQLDTIFADVTSKDLPRETLDNGLGVLDALVQSGLCQSKGEARRTISQGGAYINNRRCSDVETQLTTSDLASETVLVLRRGKNRYALLRFAHSAT